MSRSGSLGSSSSALAPQRTNTGEALGDPTHRAIQWYALKRKPLYSVRIKSYKVPRYLHDKIIAQLRADPPKAILVNAPRLRLKQLHNFLSTIRDSDDLLGECVWATAAGGLTCSYSAQVSIAHNLDVFQQTLATPSDLTVCAISTEAGSKFEPFIPWHVSITLPTSTHFRGLLEVILHDRWSGSGQRITECISQLEKREPPQLDWQARLPSTIDANSKLPYEEPSLYGVDLTLEWLREPPRIERFLGSYDWSVYISEPYNQRPKLSSLQIVDVTVKGSTQRRIVLISTSGSVMKVLKHMYDEAAGSASAFVTSHETEERIFGLLLVCLENIVSDVTQYIRDSTKLVHIMDMQSRRQPSVSKVQFFMHLRECNDWAAQACRQNARSVSDLLLSELPATWDTHRRRLMTEDHIRDLEYLARELDAQVQHIDVLKEMVIAQVELFDKRRNRNIGMFIALYVPLAFATSFFGMNIEEMSNPVSWVNTTSTNSTSTARQIEPWYQSHMYRTGWFNMNTSIDSLIDLRNIEIEPNASVSVSATQMTTDQRGSHSWPIWMFYTVAGTLTFGSIILPLIAGHVYRSIAKFSIRRRRLFRMMIAIPWALFVIIARILESRFREDRNDFASRNSRYYERWAYTDVFVPLAIDAIGSLLGLIAFVINTRRKRWVQVFAWTLWITICAYRLGFLFRAELWISIVMTLAWFWQLINWTFSRTGHSWSLYPTLSGS